MPRIVIIGAGAIGCWLSARLAQDGQDVTLVARGQRAASLRDGGVLLELDGAMERVALAIREDCEGLPPADFVFLCTKMDGLAAALDLARPVATRDTCFLTVQNGVEAHEQVARAFPGSTVIASRVHGFFEMEAGRVRHVGVPPSILCGVTSGGGSAAPLAALLSDAGIAAREAADILCELWQKFLLAASLGGVGLALGKPAGMIRHCPEGWALLEAAMQEVSLLAKTMGISLPPECVTKTLSFVASFPPEATTSLQRDVEAGLPSEYDSLTGAVVRLAMERGLELRAFGEIVRMITARRL